MVTDFGSDNKLKTQIYALFCTSSIYLALLHSKKYGKRNKRELNIGYKTIMHVKLSFGFLVASNLENKVHLVPSQW